MLLFLRMLPFFYKPSRNPIPTSTSFQPFGSPPSSPNPPTSNPKPEPVKRLLDTEKYMYSAHPEDGEEKDREGVNAEEDVVLEEGRPRRQRRRRRRRVGWGRQRVRRRRVGRRPALEAWNSRILGKIAGVAALLAITWFVGVGRIVDNKQIHKNLQSSCLE